MKWWQLMIAWAMGTIIGQHRVSHCFNLVRTSEPQNMVMINRHIVVELPNDENRPLVMEFLAVRLGCQVQICNHDEVHRGIVHDVDRDKGQITLLSATDVGNC